MANKGPYLKQNLRIAPIQKLALTPSLLQKIELLTLSHLELSEFIKNEMMENPFLEEENSRMENPPDIESAEHTEDFNGENNFDQIDYETFFEDYLDTTERKADYETYEKPVFETFAVKPSSLYDHLLWQLSLEDLSLAVVRAAEEIIGNISEDGYLQANLEEISTGAKCTKEEASKALDVVQSFDPPGVGARSLQECLLVQLKYWEMENSLAFKIIQSHLDLLESGKFEQIAKIEKCDLNDVEEAVKHIKHLNPKPGLQYKSDADIYIQPDVYIYKIGNDYVISLNEDGLPRLFLNPFYKKIIKNKTANAEEKKFIKDKFRNAVELIRNLDHRKRTIYRVCEIIVERQREFLDKGFEYLKPMQLKDIADKLGLHTSTISRAVTNKWAHCPQGVIELRKFFTLGIKMNNGEDLSIQRLKRKINDLIKNENKSRPLSDEEITKLLNEDGINIKRRTIAKYRDEMGIPNSRARKIKK